MGVYINMEMPKSCSECFVNSCKGRAKNKRLMVQRGANCPLVPVPPHGDLMDKDAAMMRFLDLLKTPGEIYTSDVGEIIANAPTIIEAEEGE